jgi:PmbA protein
MNRQSMQNLTETNKPDTSVNLVQRVLDEALEQGATAAEAEIGTGTGFAVTVRWGETEKIEHERDKSLAVTVYMGKRKGSASTSDFSDKSLAETIRAACDIARYASEDSCAGLADANLMAKEIPDLDLCHPWSITPEEAIELAIKCENIARHYDQRINNSDGAVVSSYTGTHAYGNSNGFAGDWPWSSHTIDCTVIAEQAGAMQRDGWYSKARDFNDLQTINDIGEEAAKRTIQKLGAKKLSTRNVPVIFEAPVASGLFSAFITAIAGGSLYRRASFLLDKLGEQVFSNHIHIHEQPHLKKALGSAPFDNDGVATRARDIVKDGILQGYVLSSYSARKLGAQTTGNAGGVHNLIIEPGKDSLDDLIQQMNTGLLITDMIGFGVNQVTGDYSRGASGFWVENGEVQYPVEEITVAGNLKDIYQQIVAIGNDVDPRGNILTGSVLIENMTVAGE